MFLAALRVELSKYHRTPLLLATVMVPLLAVVLVYIQFNLRQSLWKEQGIWTWDWFFQWMCSWWAIFFFPTILALFASFVCLIEHRTNSWKMLLAQPIQRGAIYLSKLLVVAGALLIMQATVVVGLLVAGGLMGLNDRVPVGRIVLIVITVLVSLPALTILISVAIKTQSFFIPIGVGLMGHFVSVIGGPSIYVRYLPWTFPLETLQIRGVAQTVTPAYVLVGIAAGLALAVAGVWQFRQMDVG